MEVTMRGLREDVNTLDHQMTHFPKNPWCPICCLAMALRKQCRNRHGHDLALKVPFGHSVTCDHVVACADPLVGIPSPNNGMGMHGERYGLVIKDIGTDFMDFYPVTTKRHDH